MFVSALLQYTSATEQASTNARFRWEYQPGSELFVVYTDGRTTEQGGFPPPLQNRSLVVKVTRLFRWWPTRREAPASSRLWTERLSPTPPP